MRRIPVSSRPVSTDKCACFDQSEAPELVLELAASATTEDHESLSAWMCEVEERERNSDGDLLRVQVRPLDHRSCFCRWRVVSPCLCVAPCVVASVCHPD